MQRKNHDGIIETVTVARRGCSRTRFPPLLQNASCEHNLAVAGPLEGRLIKISSFQSKHLLRASMTSEHRLGPPLKLKITIPRNLMNKLENFQSSDEDSEEDLKDDGQQERLDPDKAKLDVLYQQAMDEMTPGDEGSFHPDSIPKELSDIFDDALYLQLNVANTLGEAMRLPFTEQGKLYAKSIPNVFHHQSQLKHWEEK